MTRCHYYAQAEWKDRRQFLQRLLAKACGDVLQLVDVFDDDPALLRAAADQGLEGIVSKHREASYRSGHTDARIKVKVEGWIEANRHRF